MSKCVATSTSVYFKKDQMTVGKQKKKMKWVTIVFQLFSVNLTLSVLHMIWNIGHLTSFTSVAPY